MNPEGSKDGHNPWRPPRAASTTKTEHEETLKETNDESKRSRGDAEIEDGHRSHPTTASSSSFARHQSDSGATASPFNTATASDTFLKYRRHGAPSSGAIGAPPPQVPAQPHTRPHDPQTPPRNTSRGSEGDFHAGHIPRYQTQPGYHRNLTDAREDHAENPNEETAAGLAQARGAGSPFGRRPPPPQTFTSGELGPPLNPRPHVPGLTRPSQSYPTSGGYGSSLPAIGCFRRQAAQLAFEQQHGRQQTTPPPDLPRPRPRIHVPHPAHNHPPSQSSTSKQPGQPSAQPPRDQTRLTRDPSRRQPGGDEDQNGGEGA